MAAKLPLIIAQPNIYNTIAKCTRKGKGIFGLAYEGGSANTGEPLVLFLSLSG